MTTAEQRAPEFATAAEPVLLADQQVLDFIVNGYLELRPELPPEVHRQVHDQLEQQGGRTIVDREHDPLSLAFLAAVPSLRQVIGHAEVCGAIFSLLGATPLIYERVVHCLQPGQGGRGWHQDDVNVRHCQLRRLMLLYYPDATTPEMGPTFIVPGTHLRNCPTDRMQTYGNIRGQVPLIGPPGRVYIVHYDLWHSASRNRATTARYMVKYYFDRTGEPTAPTWRHAPDTAINTAMQRLHFERTAGSGGGSDWYSERHLRWRLWSFLLGQPDGVVWPTWDQLHSQRRRTPIAGIHDHQGYVGSPLY